MNFYINRFVFRFVSLFVKVFASSDIKKVDLSSFKEHKNIVYALASESAIDLSALNEFCHRNNLSKPLEGNSKNFICLKSPRYIVSEQRFKRQKAYNLEEILRANNRVIIFPVSITWGNRPDKEQSLFKIIFSPSWRPAGSLKRTFKLLIHGRNLKIQFEKPIDVNNEIQLEKDIKRSSLILDRYLRGVFRKSKQAMLGPDISHRRTLVKSLVRNKHVREEIKRLAGGSESRKRQLSKKAYRYASEVCSDLNYQIISLLASGFTWFWNTRYEGIHTKNMDHIKEISRENSLVYLPCHRSHIDYCALTYLLYENGLMVPQVAAGNNLNLPIIGPILRGAGAVFMRRSFMSNDLYSTVFFEYIRTLMMKGNSIEFFHEGGRSRTGLNLPARPGLLSLIIRSFASIQGKDVKIVPIYIGYEKILEGQSYISELSGGKKKRESILDPLKVFKDFRNYLGNAYLNFGKPIDLEFFLKNHLDSDYKISSPQEKPEWIKEVTHKLGAEVTRSINDSVAVTSTSLFSLALLTSSTQSMSEEELIDRINFYISLIENSEYGDVWITQKEAKSIISKTEKLGFIDQAIVASKKVYRPTSSQIAALSFYKNNITHLFILYSLICESIKFVKKASKEEIIKLIKLIYPIFAKEFHLKSEQIQEDYIKDAIQVLENMGILRRDDKGNIISPIEKTHNFDDYIALTNLCELTLKRFYIVMSIMWNRERILKEDLKAECKKIAEDLEVIEGWPYPEFSDNAKFDNFLYMMIEAKFFREDTEGNLFASKITNKAKELYDQFFDKEFLGFIDKKII